MMSEPDRTKRPLGSLTPPGEAGSWPKLVLRYPTDPARIDALLPPGLERCGEPVVHINIYCVPVLGEPEYGISTKIPARFGGIEGKYTLGIGIDQEAAIFISQETNGQPKFPCDVRYFRLGDTIHARATHQGTTFFEYQGTLARPESPDEDTSEDHEWWIKVSRAVGGAERAYDFPPHVVHVQTNATVLFTEQLDGALTLRESAWDPYTRLLPMTGPATAELVTTRPTGRSITVAGKLDPDGFWPFADTIGGSRWPGERGAPPKG